MHRLPDGPTAYFDVDGTLILYDVDEGNITHAFEIEELNGNVTRVVPHRKHIATLLAHKAKGFPVVVWSQQGSEWCSRVVKALGLTELVDVCMAKPYFYCDDLHVDYFMGPRIYFEQP